MNRLCCAAMAVVLGWSPVFAQEWNYPAPASDVDPADTSFYRACIPRPLPNITASRPSRIILCIGDGMGYAHLTLARRLAAGSSECLYMEQLPVRASVRTCSADNLVTDSAAAATAIACGVKTNNGMLGVTPDKQPHHSILERLDRKGWRTGLVVTCAVTHATPAGFCAHVDGRSMEEEIAAQMLAGGVDVLFGGGRNFWSGRSDGRDLAAEARAKGVAVVFGRRDLLDLRSAPALALLAPNEMTTLEPEPSLAQMTHKAIALLSAKSKDWFAPEPRFFLMVEGSQIDWAAHNNSDEKMVRQLLLFDLAVKEAIDFAVGDKRTLVIVTADHETGGLTLQSSAAGKQLKAVWGSKGHTGVDVPLFAYGPGAQHFAGALDNTDLFGIMAGLTGAEASDLPVGRHESLKAHAE